MKYLPLTLIVLICSALAIAMFTPPAESNSPLMNKPFPALPLEGAEAIGGEAMIVNVFASWCVPCASEHEQFMTLANDHHIPIIGIAWKNNPSDVLDWFLERGNPYRKVLIDVGGKTTLPLALTGVPETFILDAKGIVRYHTNEPLTTWRVKKDILPSFEKLK